MTVVALEGGVAEPASSGHAVAVDVVDEESAAAALRLALAGGPLVIRAAAPRAVLDALYDDLRRFTLVDIRTPADAGHGLTDDERVLLELLAGGLTIPAAAARLHLSPRTGERRLASARAKLGAATTLEAIARAADPGSRHR